VSEFTATHRRLLRDRADRLLRLLELKAPQPVLEMCGATLIHGVIFAVGPGVMAAVAKYIIDAEKRDRGICPFCAE